MNPWAIPSLVSAIVALLIGVYILYKNPKSQINRVFAMIMVLMCMWGVGEFGRRIALSGIPLMWAYISSFGWCFIAGATLHFVLLFTKKNILKNRLVYLILYLPGFVFYFLRCSTDLIFQRSFVEKYWGLESPAGDFAWVFTIYVAGYIILAIWFSYANYFKVITSTEKKQSLLLGTAFLIPLVVSSATDLVAPTLGIYVAQLGTLSFLPTAILLAYAILKYKLFIIEPKAENEIETPQKYTLEKGLSHLVKEEKLDKSYEIFYDQVTHGSSGLAITKLPPEKVRERYRITKSPILWLTFKEVENAISPKDIEGVKSAISDFLGKAEKPVILLDCFDQIILANGFEKSRSMLREIKDLCMKNNANLLLSVNPGMFEKEQFMAIEKDMEEVKIG